jgi:hypothetical protein
MGEVSHIPGSSGAASPVPGGAGAHRQVVPGAWLAEEEESMNEREENRNVVDPSKLSETATVPQALDNVWVPVDVLPEVLKGKSIWDVKAKRDQAVKTEWRRSLAYSDQVVVNRAYLFNNPPVYTDFLPGNANRDDFGRLLDNRVIVPYLFRENPGDQPQGFAISPEGWNAWCELGGNTRATFVKLSMDPEANHERTEDMSTEFRRYVGFLDDPVPTSQIAARSAIKDKYGFYSYVRDGVRRVKDQNPLFQRDDLYRAFLWVDEECSVGADGRARVPPVKRRFDPAKPYGRALKEVFDLKYNLNLADFLDRYPLLPPGYPDRSALCEPRVSGRGPQPLEEQEFIQALRRLAFDRIQPAM